MTVEVLPVASYDSLGGFVGSCKARDLVYFLLNVGDGDTQLLLLPESPAGVRRAIVVDVATTGKLPPLVHALADAGLLKQPPPGRPLFEVVVATHPHADHIGGMPEFLTELGDSVAEFWEPGFFHTGAAYADMMRVLEDLEAKGNGVRQSQPTSGYTRFVDQVQITVLTPAIGLRNRFDTYGVDINNSSITLRLTFPASRVVQGNGTRDYVKPRVQRLLLGADAQTTSWAHAMADFPELHPDASDVAKAMRAAVGTDPLKANVFKVPHHLSKHGLSLELVEMVSPDLSLVSSVAGGGKYNFPHAVAQEALREGRQATTSGKVERKKDHELGIHYTGAVDSAGAALGSIAVVMSPGGERAVWRFGDGPGAEVDLAAARRFSS
jgi:hypothetical protein